MGREQLHGWHPDTFGRYEERYYVNGYGTSVVRNQGVEDQDLTPFDARRSGLAVSQTSKESVPPSIDLTCHCGAVTSITADASSFTCVRCRKVFRRCAGCGKYAPIVDRHGRPASPNARWDCNSCHHKNREPNTNRTAASSRTYVNRTLGVLAVVNTIVFIIALANDRRNGVDYPPGVDVAIATLVIGFGILMYFVSTETGKRTSNALNTLSGKSTGSGSVKVVTVRHNGYPEHLARKVQAEINKQQRSGYDLISQQQETGGWMTPSATLTFKKR